MDTKQRNNLHVTGKPRRKSAPKRPETQIQYTPAKPFNRNRFLLHLATVAAVVLALVLGMSIFFKAQQVVVSGTEKYTPWEVKEASGIQDGDALLGLNEARITAKIREKLPYVGDVRVGIKLPDTVNIEIVELEVVYAVEDNRSAWWLMDAAGRIVDSVDAATAMSHTRVLGVQIQDAQVGGQAVAAVPETDSQAPSETGVPVVTVPSTPPSQLLDAGIQVLKAMENNGVMGNVDTVTVSQEGTLTLWYEDRYQVTLGDASRLDYKIGAMKAAIKKMGQYQSGYLDVSFTIWPNEVGYRPFDESFGVKK